MTVTLELPPQIERAYREEAIAKGIPVDALLREVLVERQRAAKSVFEQGLGLFGSPEDAALLDEVVSLAYEERRRPFHENRTRRATTYVIPSRLGRKRPAIPNCAS